MVQRAAGDPVGTAEQLRATVSQLRADNDLLRAVVQQTLDRQDRLIGLVEQRVDVPATPVTQEVWEDISESEAYWARRADRAPGEESPPSYSPEESNTTTTSSASQSPPTSGPGSASHERAYEGWWKIVEAAWNVGVRLFFHKRCFHLVQKHIEGVERIHPAWCLTDHSDYRRYEGFSRRRSYHGRLCRELRVPFVKFLGRTQSEDGSERFGDEWFLRSFHHRPEGWWYDDHVWDNDRLRRRGFRDHSLDEWPDYSQVRERPRRERYRG